MKTPPNILYISHMNKIGVLPLKLFARLYRRAVRLANYAKRNAAYPYSSKRQLGIRGVNHPMAAQVTPRRPGDFTGVKWGRG